MPEININGTQLSVSEEGFLTDRSQWTQDIAVAIANEEGIELTDEHWKVIKFIAKDYDENGAVPGTRRLNKVGGIPTCDLFSLFPERPLKRASKIAGCPKPASCV